MKKVTIIRFNDDNHAERIWANGKFIGGLSDIDSVFKNFLEICNKEKFDDIDSISIWFCDDFDDVEEEIVDELWEWFYYVKQMTPKQINLIKEKKWKELYDEVC